MALRGAQIKTIPVKTGSPCDNQNRVYFRALLDGLSLMTRLQLIGRFSLGLNTERCVSTISE
jgi:hypothetical protein